MGALHLLSLRTQLLVALGLLAALPVVLLGLARASAERDAEIARADRDTLLASSSLARELGRLLEARVEVTRSLAGEARAAPDADHAVLAERTERYLSDFSGIYCAFYVDPRGAVVEGTVSVNGKARMAGLVYGDRDWFHRIREGAPFASELLRSRTTGKPALILAARMTEGPEGPLEAAGIGMDLGGVQQALERITQAAPGLTTVVLDESGRVVAAAGTGHWSALEDLGHQALYRPPSRLEPEQRAGGDEHGELRRGTTSRVETDAVRWSVTATWSQASVHERAIKALEATLGFALGALLLGLVVAIVLSHAMAQPVARVSQVIEAIGRGDLRVLPPPPGLWYSRELVDLTASIERMLAHLQTLVRQLGRTAVAVRGVTQRLGGASRDMIDESHGQRDAVLKSSGAIVQITDAMAHVGSSVRSLSDAASHTTSSIVSLDRQIAQIAHGSRTLARTIEGAQVHVDEGQKQVDAVARNSAQLGHYVERTSTSLRELTDSIEGVTTRAEHSRALGRGALAAAEAGRDAVDETIKATREIHRSFSAVGDAVNTLASRSEAIGEVAGVMEQVMHATRLLGLNASIIASEAGEHGKKFGVVAARVRSMAAETAASIEEITKLVGSVQSDIRSAVEAVRYGQDTVQAGEQRSADAGVRLRAIIGSSEEAEKTINEIAGATRDQVDRVAAVQAALSKVREATSGIETAVQAQRGAQNKIVTAIAQVRAVGDDARRATEAQQAHSREMTVAVRAMTSRFQAIGQAVDAQNRERDRIEGSLGVFEGASRSSVELARQLGDVVRTLANRLEQLERELGAFRVD
jgi:methyl-accepting chemotaxis protein